MNRILIYMVLVAVGVAGDRAAQAATYTWDIVPGVVGAGDSIILGGVGTWDTTTGNWTVDGGANNIAWPASGTDNDAVFGSVAGAVTIAGGGVTANDVTFSTTGYTVQGSPLTLNGTTSTLTVGAGLADTISANVLGTAAVIKAGTGTLTISGVNAYSGTTTVQGGTLTITDTTTGSANANVAGLGGRQLSSAGLNVWSNAVARLDMGANDFSSANIGTTLSGTGRVEKAGSGAWWLGSGSGGTVIAMATNGWIDVQAGTLKNDYANANWSNNKGSLNVAGGALFDLRNNNTTIDALTGGGAVRDIGFADTLTLGVANSSALFAGTIQDGLHVVKNGSGTQTISGAVSYTGNTTVNGGTLEMVNASSFASAATVGTGATLKLSNTANQGIGAGATFNLNSGATLVHEGTVDNNAFTVLNGAVTVAGTTTINQDSVANTSGANKSLFLDAGLHGSGTCTINAANAGNGVVFRNNNSTFNGTLVVNGIASPTVNVGSGIGVGGSPAAFQTVDITLNGTMEALNQGIGWAAGINHFAMGALSGTGVVVGNFTGGGLINVTVGSNGNSGTFAGQIANGAGNIISLIKTGAGTQTLSGANIYSGSTTVNGGTLKLDTPVTTSPTNIAGLAVWLDANDVTGTGSNPADGTALSTWVNKVPGGGVGDFTGAGSAPYLNWTPGHMNGGSFVHFWGGLMTNNYNFGNSVTIMYVGRMSGGANFRLLSSVANNWLLGYWGGNMNVHHWSDSPSMLSGALDYGQHIFMGTADGVNAWGYNIDGGEALFHSGALGAGPNGLSLGGSVSFGEASYGDIGELLVFTNTLSASDRLLAAQYLQAKWMGPMSMRSAVNLSASGTTFDLGGANQTIASLTGVAGSQVLLNGAYLTLRDNTSTTFSGLIADGGSSGGGLLKTGSGTLTLDGAAANTFTGSMVVNQGYLAFAKDAGVTVLNGNLAMINNLNPSVWHTADNQLGGAGVVSFANEVNANVGNARWMLEGTTQTVAGISETDAYRNGVIQNSETAFGGPNNTDTGTLVLAGSGTYSFNGYLRDLTGVLALNKTGSGTQTLVGDRIVYTGTTTLDQGTLTLLNATGFNSAIAINGGTLQSDTSGTYTYLPQVISGTNPDGPVLITGNNLTYMVADNTYANNTQIDAGATLSLGNNTAAGSVLGAIVNNSNLQLYRSDVPFMFGNGVSGTGALSVFNTVTLSGNTINLSGTLRVGANASLTVPSGVTATFGDAWSQAHAGTSFTTITGGSLTITGAARDNRDAYFNYTQSGGTVSLGALYANQYEVGVNPGGASGNSSYTLTGGQLTVGAIWGGGGGVFDRGITLNLGGGTLTASQSFDMYANTVNLTGDGGSVTVDTGAFTLRSIYGFTGNGGLIKTGMGALHFFGGLGISGSGPIDIQQGTIQNDFNNVNWSGNTGSINVSGGALLDLYADAISLDALTGSGIVQNNFGNPSGQSGSSAFLEKLTLGVAGGSGTFSGIIRNNATGAALASGVGTGGIQLEKTGAGTQTLSGAGIVYTGETAVNDGVLSLQDTTGFVSPATVTSPGALTLNKTLNGFVNRSPLTGLISGTGVINITNTISGIGGGWVTFNSASCGLNNFSGVININSGVLSMDNIAGVWSGNPDLNVVSGGLFALRAQSMSIDALTGDGDVMQAFSGNGPQTLTLGAANGSGTFSGVIHGNNSSGIDGALENGIVSITKTGSGTQMLSGANTYSGSTLVSAGTLAATVSGALGSGDVNVTGGVLSLQGGGTLDAIANTATLNISGGGKVDVPTSGANETVLHLTLGGQLMWPGTYGATAAAGNVYPAYFTGDGIVTVLSGSLHPATMMMFK